MFLTHKPKKTQGTVPCEIHEYLILEKLSVLLYNDVEEFYFIHFPAFSLNTYVL